MSYEMIVCDEFHVLYKQYSSGQKAILCLVLNHSGYMVPAGTNVITSHDCKLDNDSTSCACWGQIYVLFKE